MGNEFTGRAKILWDAIAVQNQEKVLTNVWCPHCGGTTTMVDFKGELKRGDLVLTGICVNCGGRVARLIEHEL